MIVGNKVKNTSYEHLILDPKERPLFSELVDRLKTMQNDKTYSVVIVAAKDVSSKTVVKMFNQIPDEVKATFINREYINTSNPADTASIKYIL